MGQRPCLQRLHPVRAPAGRAVSLSDRGPPSLRLDLRLRGLQGWDPDALTAQLTRRDADLGNDDVFVLLLDTYRDRQSAYMFAVNPLGTQADARVVNDGRTTDVTWDAEWEARARIQEWGWSAEMAIPLASIRYGAGQRREWGINVGRGRRRNLELSFWTGPLDAELRVSQAGTLAGLDLPPPPSRHTGIVTA